MKILISLVIILVSINIFSQTAIAPSVGDGTQANPYRIVTLENLYWIASSSDNWNDYYLQIADIDASEDPYAFFPSGWTLETNVVGTIWTDTKTRENKKFYIVVAERSVKK